MHTRREFIASAAALPALPFGSRLCEAVPVVDTHLHCFAGKDNDKFPYHKNGPYKPDDAATPEHLLACMKEAGVDYAIVVHPEPYHYGPRKCTSPVLPGFGTVA